MRPSACVASALCVALALAACGEREQAGGAVPPPATAPAPPPARPEGAPASPAPDGDAAPARDAVPAVPPVPPAPSAQGDARIDGFGPLRLGMSGAQAEAAWPGLLGAMPDGTTRKDCFHANVPGRSYLALMFDGGRFVRYGGSPEELAAPGGGRRGMAEAALRARYGDAMQERPDRFARGGKVLATQPAGAASKLVFVLRPDGVVNEWYVGLPPQVEFDAGCESAG